jgi:hypothetical protein
MKTERSVVGKLKDGVLFLQVEAAHCQDPALPQSLDFVVHMEVGLLKHKHNLNETYFLFTAGEMHHLPLHSFFQSV